jgi:hypothetical protein
MTSPLTFAIAFDMMVARASIDLHSVSAATPRGLMAAFKTRCAVALLAASRQRQRWSDAQTTADRTQDKVAFPCAHDHREPPLRRDRTLNSYLFTTPQGHILINTNYEDTVPLLRASIEKLGFKLTDIKIILGSHAHPDHQQADAMLKELSAAQR